MELELVVDMRRAFHRERRADAYTDAVDRPGLRLHARRPFRTQVRQGSLVVGIQISRSPLHPQSTPSRSATWAIRSTARACASA